jgi:hypothetical protein
MSKSFNGQDVMEHLREFATVREHEVLDAIAKCKTNQAAADELGVTRRNLQKCLARLKKRAAQRGLSPEHDMVHVVPDGFVVKGVSTYYNKDGRPVGQWVKSTQDKQNAREIQEAFLEAFKDDIVRVAPTHPGTQQPDERLLNAYIFGDPHIGQRSWWEETGHDHDLELAEQLFTKAHDDLVERSPSATTALVLNLGDYFHADDGQNRTMRSGHNLDVDGRYQKVRKVGFRILRSMVQMCLRKHDRVVVWNIIGNHDDYSAVDLSLWLQVAYENEPRVHIETSANKFYFLQFGKVMLAATHGDTARMEQMLGVMASDQPVMWGQCTHRYAHLGHVHHKTLKDYPGVSVETHRVLQPSDLWAHNAGYRSQRDAQCITYHWDHGEYARTIVNPSMI